MKASSPFLVAAAALILAGAARADTVDFNYQWTVQPQNVFPNGTGNVSLSVNQNPVAASATIGSPTQSLLTGATVVTSSSATNLPDTFNTPFSMTLHLIEGGNSGDLSFSGTLAGSLTATTSTLTATFDNPFTKSLTLGNHDYTVTVVPSLLSVPAPGKTGPDGSPASIDGKLVVTDHVPVDVPPPHQTPEPTSLVLAGLALPVLAAARACRRWIAPRV